MRELGVHFKDGRQYRSRVMDMELPPTQPIAIIDPAASLDFLARLRADAKRWDRPDRDGDEFDVFG
jgi:hypothetical protein